MATASSSTPSPPTPVLLEAPGSTSAPRQLDGSGLTIAIISTRWYDKEIIHPLVQACKDELVSKGVAHDYIKCLQVPGAFELPFAASRMIHAKKQHLDAVICIGCMVKGATMAYEFVSEATTMGLMKLNVKTETPVVCGLLTCRSLDEAKQCVKSMGACVAGCDDDKSLSSGMNATTGAQQCNHGVSWAQEALDLAQLKRATAKLIEKKCACVCHCKEANCACACHCKQCKCRTCTCAAGACTCSSCFGHAKSETKSETHSAQNDLMARFEEALCDATTQRGCTDCGKAGDACACEDCACSTCADKKKSKSVAKQTTACGGCKMVDCKDCGRGEASSSGSLGGYYGRSSAPLKGEPNSETLP